jgi:hypothetical protein
MGWVRLLEFLEFLLELGRVGGQVEFGEDPEEVLEQGDAEFGPRDGGGAVDLAEEVGGAGEVGELFAEQGGFPTAAGEFGAEIEEPLGLGFGFREAAEEAEGLGDGVVEFVVVGGLFG